MYSMLRYVINVKCKENETSQTNIDMEKISNFFFIAHRNINVQSVIVGMIYKNIYDGENGGVFVVIKTKKPTHPRRKIIELTSKSI